MIQIQVFEHIHMKFKFSILIIFAAFFAVHCGEGDDKGFLLLSAAGGNTGNVKPADVPDSDLKIVSSETLQGTGTITELTGSSQSQEEYSVESSGQNSASDTKAHSEPHTNENNSSLVRHGKDVCSVEGRWYRDSNTIFTYEGNKPAGFCFNDIEKGLYEVELMVQGWEKARSGTNSSFPSSFVEYEILVSSNGNNAIAIVPVNTKNWEKGKVKMNIQEINPVISVSFLNPYCSDNKCVNMQLLSIKLSKDRNSESVIAASIADFSRNFYPYILAFLVLALALVAMLNIRSNNTES